MSKKLVQHLEAEIEYLRNQVKEYQDRFMAFNEAAFYKYQAKDLMKEPIPVPKVLNLMGQLESMEAKTPEEKKQKEAAAKQIHEILGN